MHSPGLRGATQLPVSRWPIRRIRKASIRISGKLTCLLVCGKKLAVGDEIANKISDLLFIILLRTYVIGKADSTCSSGFFFFFANISKYLPIEMWLIRRFLNIYCLNFPIQVFHIQVMKSEIHFWGAQNVAIGILLLPLLNMNIFHTLL